MDEHELSTKPKYIDPKTDFGFKYIFGREQSTPFLIDFLNNLLREEPGFEPIAELTYLDKERRVRDRERSVELSTTFIAGHLTAGSSPLKCRTANRPATSTGWYIMPPRR